MSEPAERPMFRRIAFALLFAALPLASHGQDQDLLQFFLNLVEFNMTPQEAVEAPGFNSFQMRASFDNHATEPGRIQLNETMPAWIRKELREMGYNARFVERSTGPITAVLIDRKHGTFWGAAGNHGEDYGIAW